MVLVTQDCLNGPLDILRRPALGENFRQPVHEGAGDLSQPLAREPRNRVGLQELVEDREGDPERTGRLDPGGERLRPQVPQDTRQGGLYLLRASLAL